MNENRTNPIGRAMEAFFTEPATKYVTIIILIISFLMITQALVDGTKKDGTFLSLADKQLALNFVEWFGVLYGFLLPTILVRVWEQFDELDNVLDREADAVKSLVGDLMLLGDQYEAFRDHVLCCLLQYSRNIVLFVDKKISAADEKTIGENILKEIRSYYIKIFQTGNNEETQASEILKEELLNQLNSIIDNRGDRLSRSTQPLFESLNLIAVVTSILWLVPFYFLYFQNPKTYEEMQLGIFGWLLVICVTFLIIIILSIIDDLDRPFDGHWMVNITSWEELVIYIDTESNSKKPQGTENNPQVTPPASFAGSPPTVQDIQSIHTGDDKESFPALEKDTSPSQVIVDVMARVLAVKYIVFGAPKKSHGK